MKPSSRNVVQLLLTGLLLFSPCQVIGKEVVAFDIAKTGWRFVIVNLGEIQEWDSSANKFLPLTRYKKYRVDIPLISIDNPSFFGNRGKLLLAKHTIPKKDGTILVVDLDNGTEEVLFQAESVLGSPVVSPNNNIVSFLGNRNEDGAYTLFVLDLRTKSLTALKENIVYGEGYNLNISWSPDSTAIFYSTIDARIFSIDIDSRKEKPIVKGFDPICSPDGQMLLIKRSQYKPYTQFVYDLRTGKSKKIKISRVFNAIWAPEGKHVIVVRNINSIFRLNEFQRGVVSVDIQTGAKTDLFQYEGYEYIDCMSAEGGLNKYVRGTY